MDMKEVEVRQNLSGEKLQMQEGQLLEKAARSAEIKVLLDERGKALSSREFAGRIQGWEDDGVNELAILIGGADGFSQDLRKRANFMFSFGKMTWPHLLVRPMLAEQLYRAQQILSGHPYHRD